MAHGDKDDISTRKIAGRLPGFMPNAPGSGNYKLLDAIGERLEEERKDINDISKATTLQRALDIEHVLRVKEGETHVVEADETEYWTDLVIDGELVVHGEIVVYDAMGVDGLAILGKLVDLPPHEGETPEHYRARLAVEFALLTGEGTISDLLHTAADVLNVDVSTIGYEEPNQDEEGTVLLRLPEEGAEKSSLTGSEVSNILDRIIAASYRVDALIVGTFTYITPSDYNDGNHDPSKGYDGLDSNGDPKDNGGTYAGLLT